MIKYQNYKGINILWAKEIPSHWHVCRISNIFEIRREKNKPVRTKEVLSLSAMYGVSLYSDKKEKGGNKPKEDFSSYNLCYPGDILVNCMNIVSGAVGISKYFGAVSPVYYPLVNLDKEKYDTRFMEYIFRNYNFQRGLVGIGKGIQMSEAEDGRLFTVRMRISWENLKVQMLIVPTIEEQEHISNYLDWKIGEIDKLINNENKKIRELEEIFNKYINSKFSVENYKNKGLRLKYIVKTVKEKTREKSRYIGLEHVISKKGILKVPYEELPMNDEGIKIEKGTVIFGKLRPYLGKTVIAENNLICSSEFLCLKPIKVTSKYLKYLMLSEKFINLVNNSTYGAKMPRANSEFILNLRVNIPDLNEQKLITNEIELFEEKIENYIYISKQKIEELKKLKNSLISEVVTGQIDVRNVKIPESK